MCTVMPCAFVLRFSIFLIGNCLLKILLHMDIEIAFFMLLIIIENSLEMFNLFFNIVSMGKDYSVLRFFSIGFNVKVYHRAGKGWIDIVSILVTEKTYCSLFSDS